MEVTDCKLLHETECFKLFEVTVGWDLYELAVSKAKPPDDWFIVVARDENLRSINHHNDVKHLLLESKFCRMW